MEYDKALGAGCICHWSRHTACIDLLDGNRVEDAWHELDLPDPKCPVHRRAEGLSLPRQPEPPLGREPSSARPVQV
ncbi:hypothetical protein Daura_21305 [Dactylosporangium aurantiacum]|uniref:Uncharacterized protein n=1 Tax=Dactylosporangium aurantiacum TaxID=35754 RepID=A0A9Q9INX8_9ACTN|nr:hypothetical protein [Dactylosporangium aurantiacum]MDG6108324.1 hypothetical protein [Dactylosporangium aurantiacum]UWZ58488.1 hypothetical protein Daura_21305 [Dactylosporangium aurantiacum]